MKRRGGWHSSWCGTNSCQPGVLEALRPIFALNEPILLAGGSVLQAVLGVRWYKKKLSDIDVFVHAKQRKLQPKLQADLDEKKNCIRS